jgi:Mg/Co/Ni transporter MgtE
MWISTMSAAGGLFWTAVILGFALAIYLVFVAPFFLRGSKDPEERMQVLYLPVALIFAVVLIAVVIYAVDPS